MPEPVPPPAASAPRTPAHSIRFHTLPPAWDLMGGQWVALPQADLTLNGKAVACMECGSVVVSTLMDAHEKRCGGAHV
jgi:hypothetical protein